MDVVRIRQMREDLRSRLPAFRSGLIDDDTLSACLAVLCEAATYRILGSRKGLDSVAVMKDVAADLSSTLKGTLLRYMPEALIVEMFSGPIAYCAVCKREAAGE